MAKKVILGTDIARDAFKTKVNDNFTELYDKDVALEQQINSLDADLIAHKAEKVQQGSSPHGIIYEEGEWTPYITANDASIANQYSMQKGYYIRQGNEIFVTGRVALSSLGSGWNSESRVVLGGLPFAIGFRGAGYPGMIANVDLSEIVNPNIEIYPGQSVAVFRSTVSSSALKYLLISNLTNTSSFQFSFSYKI
jgi:hypothetical protein